MKKTYPIIIALLGLSITSFAQNCNLSNNTIIANTVCSPIQTALSTGSYTLKARDGIILQPGFNLAASAGHSFTATLDNSVANQTNNYESATVNNDPIPSLDKSNCIPGTIGGSIDVSPSGAATYQLPIQVSPGSHGMQPNLSITYSSQGGDGLLGWGWSLSGLSSISRVNKNTYYDDKFDVITLSSSDVFALDGVRLVNNGVVDTYNPVNNPYTNVIYSSSNKSFTVTTQNGIVMEYSNEVIAKGSTIPVSWAISKITDPEGNYIQFIYSGNNTNGEYRINEIKYTGNGSRAPYNSVKFYYDMRTDINSMYVAGGKINQNVLLTAIKVYSEGSLSKDYEFTYFNDQYSKLYKISLTADGVKYNPTFIKWGSTADYTPTISDAGSTLGSLKNGSLYFGDFNGDGRNDILNWNRANTINVKLAQSSGVYSLSTINLPVTTTNNSRTSDGTTTIIDSYKFIDIQTNDINNDGKDEIMVHYIHYNVSEFIPDPHSPDAPPEHTNYSDEDIIDMYVFDGTNFSPTNISNTNIGFNVGAPPSSPDTYQYFYADWNNDGNIDRLIVKNGILLGCLGISLTPIPSITDIDDIKLLDFDGDGQLEFLVLKANGLGSIWKYNGSTFVNIPVNGVSETTFGKSANLFLGDFNGDGKTDFLVYYNGWSINYSTGTGYYSLDAPTGFTNKEPALTGQIKSFDDYLANCDYILNNNTTRGPLRRGWYDCATTAYIEDINNDGRSDIIYALNGNLKVFISNGNSFLPPQNYNIPTSVPEIDFMDINLSVIDLDGDGQKEIIYGNDDKVDILTNAGAGLDITLIQCDNIREKHENYKIISFANRLDRGQYVNSIVDGLGNISSFTYTPYKDNRQFTSSFLKPALPLMLVRGPIQVVDILKTESASTIVSNVKYNYGDGYSHIHGLGFLGFKTFTTSNSVNGMSSTSNYQHTIPNANSIYYTWLSDQTVKKGTSTLSTTSNTLNAYGTNIDKKHFKPLISSSTSTNNLTGTSSTTTINTFNTTHGAVTDQKVVAGVWEIQTLTTYQNPTGNLIRPTKVVTKKKISGDANTYTHTVDLEYYEGSTMRLKSNTNQGLKTEYQEFDLYGNITKSKVGSLNSTSCKYDDYGRFVVESTDIVGNVSKAGYRNTDGQPLFSKDPNGNLTNYAYTISAGSLVSNISTPDNNITTSALSWDNTYGLYKVEKKVTSGNIVTTYFNTIGQKVRETYKGYMGADVITVYTYNADGSLHSSQKTGLNATTYTYKPNDGRVETVIGQNLNITYSYSGSTVTTTDNIASTNKSETYDALGNLTLVTGSTGKIVYDFWPSGKVRKITTNDDVTSINSMAYDDRLNQTELIDPDAGKTTYTYNSYDQLVNQTDARIKTITYSYNTTTGLLESKSSTDFTESYTYFPDNGWKNVLKSVSRGNVSETNTYDALYRPIKSTVFDGTNTFETNYEYNSSNGQLLHVTYPKGLKIEYGYDNYGYLTDIYNDEAKAKALWHGKPKSPSQQWTEFDLGNGLTTKWGYDGNLMLNSIKTGTVSNDISIQHLGYAYNNQLQLATRTDGTLSESFQYDTDGLKMNRLSSSMVTGQNPVLYIYQNSGGSSNGNISSTSLTGTYSYNEAQGKPHAVNEVAVSTNGVWMMPSTTSTITNDNRINTMDNGTYKNTFTYGPSGDRYRVDHFNGSTRVSSKIYVSNNEFVLDNAGNITTSRTFITAPTGICAVWEKVGTGVGTFHYIHTDNQNSWLKITNSSGTLENSYSYDAWGRLRNPNTWQLLPINSSTVQADLIAMQPRFDRGYTGHEHMAGFGLINMNGRLYDPYLQRFLSPDPFVQSPTNTQSYNRYTYCYNNPLAYTDPSGYYPQGVLEGSSSGGSGFCSGGVFFGRPGQGGNGTGLNGVYYDWITGTYRSVEGGDEVGGPNIYSSDIFSSAYGQEAQDAYKGLASGTYSISLRDMGQKETLNTSGLLSKISSITGLSERAATEPKITTTPDAAIEGQKDVLFLDNVLDYEDAPYKSGGMSKITGIDCTGLVCKGMGYDTHVWLANGTPPGCYPVTVDKSSYNNFLGGLHRGDILSWEGKHAGFYWGDGQIFHAHGEAYPVEVKPLLYTKEYFGYYPNVYRQFGF